MSDKFRKVEILQDNTWKKIGWDELKAGHIFRLLEVGTDEIVDKGTEYEVCVATDETTYDKDGVPAVNCEIYKGNQDGL